jgi:hypothetical protein
MKNRREVYSRPGLKRVNYHFGQVLDADAFRAEQEYFQEKLRQHNRVTLGAGILHGLTVSASGKRVSIAPGVAVDASGRLIELVDGCSFDLPLDEGSWRVVMELVDVPCEPRPSLAQDDGPGEGHGYSRVEEVIKVSIDTVTEKGCQEEGSESICLGRVFGRKGKFRVDHRSRTRPIAKSMHRPSLRSRTSRRR